MERHSLAGRDKTRARFCLWVVVCFALLGQQPSIALISGSHGNSPLPPDFGLPTGSLPVANLSERLGYWEGPPFGGGEYHFLYRCVDTEQFNKALKMSAAIVTPKLELVVHEGPEYSFWLKDNDEDLEQAENRVDWTFTIWRPESWNHLYNDPNSRFMAEHPNFRKPVAAPKIDLYIGEGAVVWEQVEVPENVVQIDKRPGSVNPAFAGKGLVLGKVTDMATAAPIADAQVVLTQRKGGGKTEQIASGETDEQGFCQIEGIPLGYYQIIVRAAGYVSRGLGHYDNHRPELHQFSTALARPSYIKGAVNHTGGIPVPGVQISAINVTGLDGFGYAAADAGSAVTDEQGRFEIQNLPTGHTNISCRSQSWYMTNSIFEVYPIPSESIRITVIGTAVIKGKVVDEQGRPPVGEIDLDIEPPGGAQLGTWGWSGRLDEDGSFNIEGVPPGDYVITTRPNPSRADYTSNVKNLTVQAGQTYELEIIHAPGPAKRRSSTRGPMQ